MTGVVEAARRPLSNSLNSDLYSLLRPYDLIMYESLPEPSGK